MQRSAINSSANQSRAKGLEGRLNETTCNAHFCNFSVDDHEIIHEIQQFHGFLAALESNLCTTCLEQFEALKLM